MGEAGIELLSGAEHDRELISQSMEEDSLVRKQTEKRHGDLHLPAHLWELNLVF
jgi:hypothetical protein